MILQLPPGQTETWPKSADHLVEMIGLFMVLTHIAFVILLVAWFTLKRPTSLALFRLRLRAAIRRQPIPDRLPTPVRGPGTSVRR